MKLTISKTYTFTLLLLLTMNVHAEKLEPTLSLKPGGGVMENHSIDGYMKIRRVNKNNEKVIASQTLEISGSVAEHIWDTAIEANTIVETKSSSDNSLNTHKLSYSGWTCTYYEPISIVQKIGIKLINLADANDGNIRCESNLFRDENKL